MVHTKVFDLILKAFTFRQMRLILGQVRHSKMGVLASFSDFVHLMCRRQILPFLGVLLTRFEQPLVFLRTGLVKLVGCMLAGTAIPSVRQEDKGNNKRPRGPHFVDFMQPAIRRSYAA